MLTGAQLASSAAFPKTTQINPELCMWQIYRGYTDRDLQVFDHFGYSDRKLTPNCVTDFLGVRTRTAFLAGMSAPEGFLMGLPVPIDGIHAEAIEWIGLLKSVLAARHRFVAMELGAGWGPWIVAGAIAAQKLGISEIRLTAVEADPGHFDFMLDHLRDNGINPADHTLLQAAVGAESGQACWPKCADPAADWGSRPMVNTETGSDHLNRHFDDWLDVEVCALRDLLQKQSTWDLVHIDVQGWEVDLCRSVPALLDERVRWLVIATHDPNLHGQVMVQLHDQGWELENEKPPRLEWSSGSGSLQAMVKMDGTQVWRNPKLEI